MIEAFTLASGSSGNALLVRSGTSAVLMDAGRSRRALISALGDAGCSAADLAAIFITHEHTDHISALHQLSKHEGIPIHAAAPSADYLVAHGIPAQTVIPHPTVFTEQIGTLTVTSFPLPHDSLSHVGYIFRDADGDALCAATDMGHITPEVIDALADCRGALLEANHDPEMLRCGPYPFPLKQRILSPRGHLSNGDCARLAARAAMLGVTHIALGHLSAENNTPALAHEAVAAALAGTSVKLTVCARDRLTRIM